MKLTEIAVTRTIPASAEEVFDVWLDPKIPGGPWFGADRLILHPAVDGLFYFASGTRGGCGHITAAFSAWIAPGT